MTDVLGSEFINVDPDTRDQELIQSQDEHDEPDVEPIQEV